MLLVGGREAIAGNLTIGEFTLFVTLLLQLVWPLEALGWIINLGQRATAAASRSFAWLDGIESLPEPESPAPVPPGPLPIRFEDVHFSYGTGAEVLAGIDLDVEPGEIVAVCGPTGAGKTSLLNLLPRFYDPTAGRVLVGGVDAREASLAELRSAVAIVTQKPVLFSIPLRDNLLAARPDADWSDVLDACEAAGVSDFVNDLPDGYDTLIGERGVNLSGGQRQRVALARALVAGARVIVLDDPMSAVDTETERHLVEHLRPAGPRPDGAHLGSAAVDGARRRPRCRPARRPYRRAGPARGPDPRRRPVRGALRRRGARRMTREPRVGLTRLWRYTEGRHRRLAVILVLAAVSAAAPVAGWHVVGDAIDNGIRASDDARLVQDVVLYVAIGVVAWVLGTATWLMLAHVGQRMVLDLRRDLFEHLTSLSLRYFSQQKAGWIIARLTSDVDALSDVLNQGLTTLVVNTLTLIAAIGGLFLLDWRLGLVALLVLPPGMLITRWFQRTSHAAFSDVRTRISAVTAQLAESVAGMAVVQAFNRERAFQREFEDLNEANRISNTYAQKLSSVFFPAIELLGVIAQVAVIYAGARMIDGGALEIGTLIAAVGMLSLVFQPLQELSELYGQVQAASAAMGKISTVLDAERDITDRPDARELHRIDGRLELDRVVFAYGEEPVIHGLELDIPSGGCIALVGESGGGKSTTAKLVARFYDPDEGAVRVDGVDLRDVRLRSYRRQLGVVLQDPFLFSGTIADNIRFARPDATDEEIEAAARAIGVDRVAARFEEGLDHVVREGGAGLSAGERQLISIARALVADPRVLILDEATSNIDRPSEVLIERAFDTLLRGRTSIIIAHRLATVRRADEILVLERGRITQRGTYDELMAVEGPFRRLATTLSGADVRRVA